MTKPIPPRLPTERLRDWQERLERLVLARLHQPFRWGERDCCLWAADAVQAVTGVDVAADFRGQYDSASSATRLLNRRIGILAEVCDERLGPPVLPVMAQSGDVGMVREPEAPALVVLVGSAWMGQGTHGLVPVDPQAVQFAWRGVAECRKP